jgi:hypothetical protein
MHSLKLLRVAALMFFVTMAPLSASSQVRSSNCVSPADFAAWINCRYDEIAAARISQRGNTQQVEMPSIAENTTSLVDQSAAPDLMGLALDLAGLNKASDSGKTAMAATFSAYALYARGANHEALDPAFYTRHAGLRRFSFTIGRDEAEAKAGANDAATLLGGKILLVNRREVTRKDNLDEIDKVSKRLNAATPDFLATVSDVEDYLYNQLAPGLHLPVPGAPADKVSFINNQLNTGHFAGTLAVLTSKQLDEIDEMITKRINSKVELIDESLKAFETIRRRPQLSFTIQSKLRNGTGIDEYQTGLTYDYGLYNRLNLTLNGTFNYRNSSTIGGDTRGGKLAAEARFQLTPDKNILGGTGPFLFSLSSSAEWLTKTKPTYIGQAKFTIPIYSGINLPISVSFSNNTGLIKESKVRGRFGFTLDLAKLLSQK